MTESIRLIELYYDNANSRDSALKLILTLRPEWKDTENTIEFVRFKDGITNTVGRRQAVPSASGLGQS